MSEQLRIQPDQVRRIANDIAKKRNDIEFICGELRSLDGQLLEVWEGTAQITFQETYGNWVQKLDDYVDTLDSVKAYLDSVAANYEELDAAAQQAAASAATPT